MAENLLLLGSFKFLVFLLYATSAVLFLILSMTLDNKTCKVQNTYKQDFLTNVHANPFYTSTYILSTGPVPGFEVRSQTAQKYEQRKSHIAIFPVMHRDTSTESAFQEAVDLPPQQKQQASLYVYDSAKGTLQAAANSSTSTQLSKVISTMMAGSAQQLQDPGNGRRARVLANLDRCVYWEDSTMSSQKMEDARLELMKSSHRAGTCLLTGQQPMVEISSNYKTSLVPFSSVNLMFAVAVVCWISASFAIFYFSTDSFLGLFACFANCQTYLEDVFLGIPFIWNIILVILSLTDAFSNQHVPVNNIAVAVLLLLFATGKQIQWAGTGIPIKDKRYLTAEYNAKLFFKKGKEQRYVEYFPMATVFGGSNAKVFQTTNFFHQSGKKAAISTGEVFAQVNYMTNHENNLNLPSIQNMEFMITTSLLSASILASYSSIVPTGMVQLLFVTVIALHVAARAAIKLSKMGNIENQSTSLEWIDVTSYFAGIVFFFLWCLFLTIVCISIEIFYYVRSEQQGEILPGLAKFSLAAMMFFHLVFFLATVVQVCVHARITYMATAPPPPPPRTRVAPVGDTPETTGTTAEGNASLHVTTDKVFFYVHCVVNLLMKVIVGACAFTAASSHTFQQPNCGIWSFV